MARFKRITGGHPVIMGRRTFESIGKPLPGRVNIIVTRKSDYIVKGATVVDSLDKAWEAAQTQSDEIFVIGGASIYEQALPYCGKLYLTVVDDEPRADTYFPAYKDSFRKVIRRESGEDNGFKYEFWELAR
jgi:dihydrofolate reductase